MKRVLIYVVLTVLAIVAIFAIYASFVTFSSTSGRLVDPRGIGISDAEIRIVYHCREPKGFVDSDSKYLSEDIIKTNNDGRFSVAKRFFNFQSPFLSQCEKVVTAQKIGYSYYRDLCIQTGTCESIETICHDEKEVSLVLYRLDEAPDSSLADINKRKICPLR